MEGSREGALGYRLSEEFQDDSGLELSLGLGLSSTDLRQKQKMLEGSAAHSAPSVDHTGEPSAGGSLNGMHSYCKPKPSSKASGLDAALKKFLEGRLDEQDENGKLLDGSNSFNLQKDKDKSTSTGPQEKPGLEMDNKGKPFLFRELQGSSGLANSRGQSPSHISPLQLVDAFKIAPLESNANSPHSAEGVGLFDGDEGALESSEQHKKFQEARKKRKHPMEEQKHQKEGEKDDKAGTHGFRRPGSNSWVCASALDMDKALLSLRGDDASDQFQPEVSQESDDGAKGYETDGNDSTGCDKNANADKGPNESRGTCDDSKGVDMNFMPQLQAPETDKKVLTQTEDHAWNLTMNVHAAASNMQFQGREISLKRMSSLPNDQKDGHISALAIGREGDKAGSPLQRQIEKVPSETSSASTDGTEKLEEKSRGGVGEASSSVPEVMGSDKGVPVLAATSFFPPAATMSSAAVPYSMSPYPVVQMPYSLPGSITQAPGMPFPAAGLNFPYVMQYMPSDCSEQSSMRPIGSSLFQPPAGIEYLPPQLSSLEGTSWMQALRPPVVSPFANASNGTLYGRKTIEDASNRLHGTRVHGNGGDASAAANTSSSQNHPSFHAVVHNSTQDSQLQQGPDVARLSSPIPAVSHGLPGGSARPPSSSGVKDEAVGGKAEQTHHRNIMEQGNVTQEEFTRAVGAQFHLGSTDNVYIGDALGEDLALLQRGLAPGLKFGGSGTPPDLPWVYTTGPNGKTIGGVLYRLNQTQLRVVCACHGKHMSPAEFTQHAGDVDPVNTEKNIVVNSSPLTGQTL